MADPLKETVVTLEQIQKALQGVSGITLEYQETLSKATSAMLNKNKMLADGVKKTSEAYQHSEKSIKALVQQMALLKQESKVVADAQAQLEKQAERLSKGYLAYAEDLQKIAGFAKNAISAATQYTAILGVQSLGLKTVTERGLKYNQALFDLSRIQQVSGKGTRNLAQAFGTIKEKTTLAKDQFAKMASEIGNVNLGLAPTPSEIADVASVMKDRFGPATDIIIAKTKEFFEIQSEWPDLADEITKAQAAIAKGNEAEAKSHQSLALTMARQSGMNVQSIKSIKEMTTKSTQEQKDQVKTNEQIAKTTQEYGDLQLSVFSKMEPALQSLSVAAEDLAKQLAKIPEALALISGGMESAGLLGTMGGGMLIGKGLQMMASRASAKAAAKIAVETATTEAATAVAAKSAATAVAAPVASNASRFAGMASRAGGLLSRAGMVGAAGAAGYGAGKLLDYGFEKITGKSLSNRGAELIGKTGIFGGNDTPESEGAGKRAKRLRKEQQEQQKSITKETKETTKEAKKTDEEYMSILQNQKKWLANLDAAAGAMSEIVSMGEKLSIADVGAANSMRDQYEVGKKIAEITTETTLKMIKQNLAAQGIAVSINEGKDASEKLRNVMEQINIATVTHAKDEAKIKALAMASNDASQQGVLIKKQQVGAVEAMTKQMNTELTISKGLNDMYENRLNTERQLMESAQFGLGASVEMMQKQVNLIQRRMEANKEALSIAEQTINADKKISDEQMSRLQNARSDIEIQNASLAISKATGKSQSDLINYAKQYNEVTTDSMKQQQKILEITKEVREGYLSAMKQMAFGFGQFGKIIGTQTRGAKQLMDLTKKVTGTTALNTMAMGGTQGRVQTAAGVGAQVTATYGAGGYQSGVSKEQESARFGRIWKYQESVDKAKRGEVPALPIGTAVAAGDKGMSVLMGQAAIGQGARTIKNAGPGGDIAKQAFLKGSSYTSGAVLPGQQGIPSNYSGGPAAATFGAEVLQGSKGQVSQPSGGTTLISPQASISSPIDKLIAQQETTNMKLDDLIAAVSDGIAVNVMNSA